MLGTLALDDDDEVGQQQQQQQQQQKMAEKTKKLLLRIVSVGRAEGQGLVGKEFVIDSDKAWIVGKAAAQDPAFGSVVLEHKYVSSRHARLTVKDSLSMEVLELPNVTNGTKVKVEDAWHPISQHEPRLVYVGMRVKFADVEILVAQAPEPKPEPKTEQLSRQVTPTLPSKSGFGATIIPDSDEDQEIVFQKPASKPVEPPTLPQEEPLTLQFEEKQPTVGIGGEEEPLTVVKAAEEEGEPTEGGSEEAQRRKSLDVLEPTQPGVLVAAESDPKAAAADGMEPTQAADVADFSPRFDRTVPLTEKTIVMEKEDEGNDEMEEGPTLIMGKEEQQPTQAWFDEEMRVSAPAPVTLGTATQTPIGGLAQAPRPAAQDLDIEEDDDDPFDFQAEASPSRGLSAPLVTASQRIMGPDGDMEDDMEPDPRVGGGSEEKQVHFSLEASPNLDKMTKDALQDKLRGWGLSVTGSKAELLQRVREYRNVEGEKVTEKDDLDFDDVPLSFDSLNVAELKAKLKGLGLPVSGVKSELVARLKKAQGKKEAVNAAPASRGPEAPAAVVSAVKSSNNRLPRGGSKSESKLSDELEIEEEITPAKRERPPALAVKSVSSVKKSPSVAKKPSSVGEFELEEEVELNPKKMVSEDLGEVDKKRKQPASKKKSPAKEKAKKKSPANKRSLKEEDLTKKNDDLDLEEEEVEPAPKRSAKKSSPKVAAKKANKEDVETASKKKEPLSSGKNKETAKKVFWYWAADKSGPKSHWSPYDDATSAKLESDLKAGKFRTTLENNRWVDLNDLVQRVKDDPSKRRPVFRSETELKGNDLKREVDEPDEEEKKPVASERAQKKTPSKQKLEERDEEEEEPVAPKRAKTKEPAEVKPSALKKQKSVAQEEDEPKQQPQKKKSAGVLEKKKSAVVDKKRGREEEEDDDEKALRIIVASTGINDAKQLKDVAKLESLGAEVTNEVSKCTHLVTAGKVLRTVKMLSAINSGCANVVTFDWVKESLRAGKLLDGEKWAVKDAEMEKKYHFRLEESLRRAREARLFEGMVFYCTENTLPPPDQLKEIVESGGGTVKTALPAKSNADAKLIVVSCEKDKVVCEKLKGRFSKFYIPELILTGVLQQKLDFDQHKLLE